MKLKKITIASIHPEFLSSYSKFGPLASCLKKNLITLDLINLRDFAVDHHGTVDGKPFGGDDGMVLRPEPIAKALASTEKAHVILTSPQGQCWQQKKAESFVSKHEHIFIICGRFSGVDERVRELYVDEEISCGDFILSGGELAALILTDSMIRYLPKALGNDNSVVCDSFAPKYSGMLEHPLYTKPRVFEGKEVPSVLLSGDHSKIKAWQEEARLLNTKAKRKDLILKAKQ